MAATLDRNFSNNPGGLCLLSPAKFTFFLLALSIPCEGLAKDGAPFGVFGFFCHFVCNLDFENVLGISTFLQHRAISTAL